MNVLKNRVTTLDTPPAELRELEVVVEQIQNLRMQIEGAVSRLANCVGRLTGEAEAQDTGQAPLPGGLLAGITCELNQCRSEIGMVHAHIARLERIA